MASLTPSDLLTTGLLSGGLIYVVKKISEMKTPTTPIVKELLPTTGRFFGGRSDITKKEWQKGFKEMMDFSTPYTPIDISHMGKGEKLDFYPRGDLFGLGPITEIKQPVTIDTSKIDFAKLDWIPRKGF